MAKTCDVPEKEIYNAAKESAEIRIRQMEAQIGAIREESYAIGFLDKVQADRAYNEFMEHMMLYRVKQAKTYKTGGMTWAEFCEHIGRPVRTVDNNLRSLRPFFERFSANVAEIAKLPFNKIRYLGEAISANSAEIEGDSLVVDGIELELKPENKADIEALIEELKATQKRETEALRDQVKAQKRVVESKQKYADKLEEEMARYKAEREGAGFEPGEEEFLDRMKNTVKSFHGMFVPLDAAREGDPVPAPQTRAMVIAYINALAEIRNLAKANLETAEDVFGITADEAAGWQPPEPAADGEAADEPDEDAPAMPANVTPLTRTETE